MLRLTLDEFFLLVRSDERVLAKAHENMRDVIKVQRKARRNMLADAYDLRK